MADSPEKPEDSAEKAYAAAASEMKPAGKAPAAKASAAKPAAKKATTAKSKAPAKPKAPAKKPATAKKAAAKTKAAPKAKPAPKPAAKPAAKPVTAATPAPAPAPEAKPAPAPAPVAAKAPEPVAKAPAPKPAPKPVPKPAPVAAKAPAPAAAKAPAAASEDKKKTPLPTVSELKDMIMATAKTPDYSNMLTEMQSKAKDAYEKGTEAMGEATEFAKGNVEALVESGKILAGGMQDMGKTVVDEAKSAYETMTADMKEMAAVKSPTELFQLQGKIMRRNFDSLVATSSKNTEAMMKLANDAFAPLSGRMNVAAEKISKVAA